MSSILDASGKPIVLQTPSLEWDFTNPKSDIVVCGPSEEFLRKIKEAFDYDACYIRFGTEINHKLFKRIIVFGIKGLSRKKQLDMQQYVYYLYSRLEDREVGMYII